MGLAILMPSTCQPRLARHVGTHDSQHYFIHLHPRNWQKGAPSWLLQHLLLQTLYTDSSSSQKAAGMHSVSLPLAGRLPFRRMWTSKCPSRFVQAQLLLYTSDMTVSKGWSVIRAEVLAHLYSCIPFLVSQGGFA